MGAEFQMSWPHIQGMCGFINATPCVQDRFRGIAHEKECRYLEIQHITCENRVNITFLKKITFQNQI